MLTFLYVIQFIIAILLILLVMFQKTEGGANLISSNPYNSFFSTKALVANPLTKITIIFGFLFFLNSVVIGAIYIAQNKSAANLIDKIEAEASNPTNNNAKSDSKKLEVPLGK